MILKFWQYRNILQKIKSNVIPFPTPLKMPVSTVWNIVSPDFSMHMLTVFVCIGRLLIIHTLFFKVEFKNMGCLLFCKWHYLLNISHNKVFKRD